MDNLQQPIQTSPIPPENFSDPKKRMNSKIIIISVLVGLVVLVATGYAFYRYSQSDKNATLPPNNQEQVSATKTGCSLSGQTAQGKILGGIETKFTNLPSDADKGGEIIARVINAEPFIVEVLDSKPYPSYVFDGLGIQEGLFVSQSEKDKIQSLKFNDIISGNLYGFTYASVELAFGTAIKDIKKIDGQVSNFSSSPNPFANRSGTLIRYTPTTTNSNGFILIFNDKKVFYRDNNNNIFADKQLTEEELGNLLKLFSQTNFDDVASDFSVSHYSPSLSLICNRYQPISLNQNSSNLKLITDKLDSIIDSYRSEAMRKLTYNKKYIIKNWEYESVVPLDEANKITFMQENKVRLSQIKPSESLKKEVDEFNTYYRYKGKIYGVYFGSCVDGSADTWGCFGAEELKTEVSGGRHYKIWPQELSVKLKDVSTSGIKIPEEEYLAHKDFYDTLLTWQDNLLFLEGDYLYQRLWVSLE